MKKIFLAIWISIFIVGTCGAQTNVIYGYIADLGLSPQAGVAVTLSAIDQNPILRNGIWVSKQPVTKYTDSNGFYSFKNVPFGQFEIDAGSSFVTGYINPNTVGSNNVALLATNTYNINIVASGTNNITVAAADSTMNVSSILGGYSVGANQSVMATLAATTNIAKQFAASSSANLAPGTGITFTTNAGVTSISLYVAPIIQSFGNNQNIVEQGSVVTSTLLTWTLGGGAITSQSIDNGIGSIVDLTQRSTNQVSSYTLNRTYNLTITDGVTPVTASTSIAFESQIYFGVSGNTSLTDAQIIALGSSQFATTRNLSFSPSPSAQYIYVAYPAAFGAATFFVNGLLNTDWTLVTRSFVNASSYGSSYNIYRNNSLLTGTYSISVQ